MKEINKYFLKIIILIIFCTLVFSCKTYSLVNFESESFRAFKDGDLLLDELPEEFYYTRILTAICVDIVFLRFSKFNDFNDVVLDKLTIKDDKGEVIFNANKIQLKSHNGIEILNNCNYKVYFWEIPQEQFDRNILRNYKTKYVILNFEIERKNYSKKLKRVEKKYILTRT